MHVKLEIFTITVATESFFYYQLSKFRTVSVLEIVSAFTVGGHLKYQSTPLSKG
jgi:hypothetical protein